MPLTQVVAPVQANEVPQPPQSLLLVCSLTQAPAQLLNPPLHVKVQALPTHAGWALATPVEQTLPQPLQLLASLA